MSKIEGSSGMPQDLPKDIQAKFQVEEAVESKPAADPKPASVEEATGKKTSSKDQANATESAKTAAAKSKKAAAKTGKYPDEVDDSEMAAFEWPNRRPAKDPVTVGEKQSYEITYFGMVAGDFELEVLPHKSINRRKTYHVKGTAVSSKLFSMFYRLNDTVETFFDYEGFFSHRFQLELDESKQTRASLELNDSERGQTYYWNRWNHHTKGYVETKGFHAMPRFPQDSLSALYYIRTLPLKEGKVYTFPVVSEGNHWEAVVTVVKKEVLQTKIGKVKTLVLKPETKYQGILQKKGDSFIWVTDDERKLLVRLEAKVRIGTITAVIKESFDGDAKGRRATQ